jgi:hypothetical protein
VISRDMINVHDFNYNLLVGFVVAVVVVAVAVAVVAAVGIKGPTSTSASFVRNIVPIKWPRRTLMILPGVAGIRRATYTSRIKGEQDKAT